MKLYELTASAHVDDLETLDVHLDLALELPDPSLRNVVLSIAPAHLRKMADDLEAQAAQRVQL